jgi:hypothetical protein
MMMWPCNVVDRPKARKLPTLDPNSCGPSAIRRGVDGRTYYVHHAKTGKLSWKLAPPEYSAVHNQFYNGRHPFNNALLEANPRPSMMNMRAAFPCTAEDRPKARKLPKKDPSKCAAKTRKRGVDGKMYVVKVSKRGGKARWVLDTPVQNANKCLICDTRRGGRVRRFIPGCKCPNDIKVCNACFAQHRVHSKNARCPWCRIAPKGRVF